MGHTTTRQLIEDYISITGRPVATLTVDEYIKFATATVQVTGHSINHTFNSKVSELPKVTDIIEQRENIEHIPTAESPFSHSPNLKMINKETNQEKKKPTKEEMMKFIKSVSG